MPNYSDYRLYQILESNGYKTTASNLNVLKEGLANETVQILEKEDHERIGQALDESLKAIDSEIYDLDPLEEKWTAEKALTKAVKKPMDRIIGAALGSYFFGPIGAVLGLFFNKNVTQTRHQGDIYALKSMAAKDPECKRIIASIRSEINSPDKDRKKLKELKKSFGARLKELNKQSRDFGDIEPAAGKVESKPDQKTIGKQVAATA